MLHLNYTKHTSIFKKPGGTSRGVLHSKDSWIISLFDINKPTIIGIGEVSIIENLNLDNPQLIEEKLQSLSKNLHLGYSEVMDEMQFFPAIQFGFETAFLDLTMGGQQMLFPSDFINGTSGIPINGLVWMGSYADMKTQLKEKLKAGFTCIKVKVGAINFEEELALLAQIRREFSPQEIEIRVDANGAFSPQQAEEKLKCLAEFNLHSIEQPIKQGQLQEMARLCEKNILPIALDEELIGIFDFSQKEQLLDAIKPQHIILKPSLLGGFERSNEWIDLAEKQQIGWWATSALETNVGLNAIAQWVAAKNNPLPQGLGTGQLFTNNFPSPLEVREGELWHNKTL